MLEPTGLRTVLMSHDQTANDEAEAVRVWHTPHKAVHCTAIIRWCCHNPLLLLLLLLQSGSVAPTAVAPRRRVCACSGCHGDQAQWVAGAVVAVVVVAWVAPGGAPRR